jgi:hypothetical protein
MTKTISSQKNMAMTTQPIGTISSTLVFSSAPKNNSHWESTLFINKAITVLGCIAMDYSTKTLETKVDSVKTLT